MRAANEINLKMAPLTPDHHFYIDQGANAHVRLVLVALGEKLVEMGMLDAPTTRHVPLQRAARVHRRAGRDGRTGDRRGRQGQAGRRRERPAQGLGRHRHGDAARLPIPEPVGLPRQVLPARRVDGARSWASAGRRASSRAWRGSSCPTPSSTASSPGRDPRLRDDQPGLAGPLREDHRGRDRRGRDLSPTRPCLPASTRSRRSSVRPIGTYRSRPATGSASTATPASSRSSSPAPGAGQRRVKDQDDPPDPISRSVLSDHVKDRLLEAILDGRYPPGVADRRDPGRPGVRDQPGSRSGGAP